MQCTDTYSVIDLLPKQLIVHIDVKVTSSRQHSTKIISTTVGNSIVSMVIDYCIIGN